MVTFTNIKMTEIPKLQKKSCLSLNSRLHKTKKSESPQNRLKGVQSMNGGSNMKSSRKRIEIPRSPSVISVCSDECVENTPPRKKMTSMDDSLDYSACIYENSFSPSLLMSQTVAMESPEVSWKWTCNSNDTGRTNAHKLDSISSSNSASSNSTDVSSSSHRDVYKLHEKKRKKLEQELRKEEKMRNQQKLQERYTKLRQQLESSLTQEKTKCPEVTIKEMTTIEKAQSTASVNNYFDDSMSDDLLVAATQEIEAQLNILTQTTTSSGIVSTTPTSSKKQKRSLFSSKFFEDDDTDDWFLALDEDVLQAKPKTPLQRHKSLPVNGGNADSNSVDATNIKKPNNSSDVKKLKRHISTHNFSTNLFP